MKQESIEKTIARQPEILMWYGTPSDHSGAYHVILSLGIDGIPVEVAIENPDSPRLEIPGLLDSGWEPDLEKLVAKFFKSANTCHPKKGVYFDKKCIKSIEGIEKQLHSLCPKLEAFFNNPAEVPLKIKSCNGSLLIYSQIGNHIECDLFNEFFDPEKGMMEKLGACFSMIKQFMSSGSDSEGFVQFISNDDWMSLDVLTDLFCFWLWDSKARTIRRFSDG